MLWLADSPEYEQRRCAPFAPTQFTLAQVHAIIPKHLFQKSTSKGVYYVLRDIFFAVLLWKAAWCIEPLAKTLVASAGQSLIAAKIVRVCCWLLYWWLQGVVLAGWWCLGHEAGHANLSQYGWINHAIGFSLHTALLVPYYAWRSSHQGHHKATGSIERDENYVPRTRADYNLPPAKNALTADYHEIFEETPIYTLFRMLLMQALGWQFYLATNALGSPSYPEGTNKHLSPDSALFKPPERRSIIISNVGLVVMSLLLCTLGHIYGWRTLASFYIVPYLLANHWIVLLTFLHHSDPTIPHYRSKQWSFLRGALATVDRPLLGWMGRFFLHNVSHDHIAHHLFSTIPFYNQPQVTELLKGLFKEQYNYDTTNSFRALYRSFTECCFIENEGDIVFYKNRHGQVARELASHLE